MPANLTEGSSHANQTVPTVDSSPVACTEIVTFTEVLAAEEWGSFYSSFKVR
ncbi:neuropeptide S receptor isoform X1, partial [Sigmodon hispidus]